MPAKTTWKWIAATVVVAAALYVFGMYSADWISMSDMFFGVNS